MTVSECFDVETKTIVLLFESTLRCLQMDMKQRLAPMLAKQNLRTLTNAQNTMKGPSNYLPKMTSPATNRNVPKILLGVTTSPNTK